MDFFDRKTLDGALNCPVNAGIVGGRREAFVPALRLVSTLLRPFWQQRAAGLPIQAGGEALRSRGGKGRTAPGTSDGLQGTPEGLVGPGSEAGGPAGRCR